MAHATPRFTRSKQAFGPTPHDLMVRKAGFVLKKSRQTEGSESPEIVVVSRFITYIFARTE